MQAGWMISQNKPLPLFTTAHASINHVKKSLPTPTKTPITTRLAESLPDFTHSSSLQESGHARAVAVPANQQRLIDDPRVYFMYPQKTPSPRPDQNRRTSIQTGLWSPPHLCKQGNGALTDPACTAMATTCWEIICNHGLKQVEN